MEQTEKLRGILRDEFGITTDEQLRDALERLELPLEVFTYEPKGEQNAKTA